MLRERQPDLLVLDLHMPEFDGFQVLEQAAATCCRPAARSRSSWSPATAIPGDEAARAQARRARLRREAVQPRRGRAADRQPARDPDAAPPARGAEPRRSKASCRCARGNSRRRGIEILERLALAAEYRDDDTGDHARRVGQLAGQLALTMGLAAGRGGVDLARGAAARPGQGGHPRHDPAEERPPDVDRVRGDPHAHGDRRGDPLRQPRPAAADGRADRALAPRAVGRARLPAGLSGTDIPLAGRITAVADAFDVMTHHRRYGDVLTTEAAIRRGRARARRAVRSRGRGRHAPAPGARGPRGLTSRQ